MTDKRLIEEAFPLKQASIDSVHEKNVRHGHISTLHIWPARRPLAASRAAIIAALLPDPGDAEQRHKLIERIGGKIDAQGATQGGVLRWGREQSADMDYFRQEIKKAFGGRAPKVLDMFAGGGAIPLEAMRLGCDVTAVDYNPVAWFILKCTLEYPSKLAGKRWPLPPTVKDSDVLLKSKQTTLGFGEEQHALGDEPAPATGDLADHVRFWGNWVLDQARKDLAQYYPTLPLRPELPAGPENPQCPAVAYLWARTVPHPDPKMNGLQIPLLKTLWLCKKEATKGKNGKPGAVGKKRALRPHYNSETNRYDFEVFTPEVDSEVGPGTMSRTGVQPPAIADGEVGPFIRSDYLQRCGKEGKIGAICTAVVVDASAIRGGKEYRSPASVEFAAVSRSKNAIEQLARIMHVALKLPTGCFLLGWKVGHPGSVG